MLDELTYSKRYARGKITLGGVFPNHVDLELEESRNGIGRVRVSREHWPADRQDWRPGEQVEVFLYNLSGGARAGSNEGHWFGSMRFAVETENPWYARHQAHPMLGATVQGKVLRLAGLRSCIVRLDMSDGSPLLLDAYMERTEVPSQFNDPTLEQLFPVGLQVEAEIVKVDTLRCAIDLSVNQIIDARRRSPWAADASAVQHPQTAHLWLIGSEQLATLRRAAAEPHGGTTVAARPWAGYSILLLEDDRSFGRVLLAWLRTFGAKAWHADNLTHAQQLLADEAAACSHVLVDYGMESRGDRAAQFRLLHKARKLQHVALITGSPDAEAANLAARLGLPLLAKPISFSDLDTWLRGGTPSTAQPPVPGVLWQQPEIIGDAGWERRAQAWLEALCGAFGAQGAAWVQALNPGHEVVVARGLPNPVGVAAASGEDRAAWLPLAHRMGQTLLADVERDGAEHITTIEKAGPLSAYWPAGATQAHALALGDKVVETEGSSTGEAYASTDILLWFDADDAPATDRPAWPLLREWWQDVRLVGRLHERMTEDAVFATQGRVHMATLHELAALMQPFATRRTWSADEAVAWWDSGCKALHFIKGGLYQIRRERDAKINLYERLHTLMQDFLWQLAARREVNLVAHLPPRDLLVHLPPEVIEQPLINLVDNATKAVGRRRWGRVEVRVMLDAGDAERPLVIRVSDDGTGLTPEEVRHCRRRSNIDPPCRSNIDPGMDAGRVTADCG